MGFEPRVAPMKVPLKRFSFQLSTVRPNWAIFKDVGDIFSYKSSRPLDHHLGPSGRTVYS